MLSIVAAQFFQSSPAIEPIKPAYRSAWVTIEKPFPAYALDIPEAAGVPASYVIRRNVEGGGRKDILTLGEAGRTRRRSSRSRSIEPATRALALTRRRTNSGARAAAAGPIADLRMQAPLPSKFGAAVDRRFRRDRRAGPPLPRLPARSSTIRRCRSPAASARAAPTIIERSTLACALDRLTLLAAGSEPKIGALFAQAELNRRFCGERDPILAATPKYKLLWRALANRPEPRRIGR